MDDGSPVLVHHDLDSLLDRLALSHLHRTLDRLHRRRRVVRDLLRDAPADASLLLCPACDRLRATANPHNNGARVQSPGFVLARARVGRWHRRAPRTRVRDCGSVGRNCKRRAIRQNGGRFIDRPRVTCLTRAYASSVARRVVPRVQTTSRSVVSFRATRQQDDGRADDTAGCCFA